MSRVDVYEPKSGGHRASLAANYAYTSGKPDYTHVGINNLYGVGLNAAGRVVLGKGQTGIIGVINLDAPQQIGARIDIFERAQFLEFKATNGDAGTPATRYYADNTSGEVSSTGGAGKTLVGWTVEADRLVVRMPEPGSAT